MAIDPTTEALVKMEMAASVPHTQEAACRLAARVAVAQIGAPATDDEFRAAAESGAIGLFGPAFETADDDQRAAWIDMYEAALREAAATPVQ